MIVGRKFLFILCAIFWIAGCSNSHILNTYEDISLKENATIEMKSFEQIQVTNTIIKQDSVHAIRIPDREDLHFQASEINRIVVS